MKGILASIGGAVTDPDVVKTNMVALGGLGVASWFGQIDKLIEILVLTASLAYTATKATIAIAELVRTVRQANEREASAQAQPPLKSPAGRVTFPRQPA